MTVELHLGDCLEVMRSMPDKSVDAVITDPPVTVCPDCNTVSLRKLFEPTPVHYKGRGYYVTDKYKPEKQG